MAAPQSEGKGGGRVAPPALTVEGEREASSHSLCEGGGRGAMGQGEGGGQADTWLVGVGGDG